MRLTAPCRQWSIIATPASLRRWARTAGSSKASEKAEADATVDRPVRGQVRGGEDDVRGDAEVEDPAALLEAEAEAGPEAVLRLRGLDVEARVGVAAIDARIAGDGELEKGRLAGFGEELAGGEADLQARETAARAQLELVVGPRQPAQSTADVPEGSELVAPFGAHHPGGRALASARSAREIDLVGQGRRAGREDEQE